MTVDCRLPTHPVIIAIHVRIRPVLVSSSKKFIFVHVQKTAGSSIRKVLDCYAVRPSRSLANKLLCRLGWRRDYRKLYLRPHARIRKIEEVMPPELFAGFFKFAFVRNPWDRLVSWYSFISQHPEHRRYKQVAQLGSFEAYLRFEIKRNKTSQWDMLIGRDGTLKVDYVGRFENLRADFAQVSDRLEVEAELPHVKLSKHRPYQMLYTRETAELVRQHWHNDIEAFGYEFEGEPGG